MMKRQKQPSQEHLRAKRDFTIVFFGKTGAGKSTTINALFNLEWPTDRAVACTKKPHVAVLSRRKYKDLPYDRIRVVDMPGIGESLTTDQNYMPYYRLWLKQADSLVWIIQANTRGYKRDEIFLKKLLMLFQSSLTLTIGINRVDRLGVSDNDKPSESAVWSPSFKQLKFMQEKVDDVYKVLGKVINSKIKFEEQHIVPYAATYKWELESLRKRIMERNNTHV